MEQQEQFTMKSSEEVKEMDELTNVILKVSCLSNL